MFGSYFVKYIVGNWDHVGYMTTEDVALPAVVNPYQTNIYVVPTLPKGTWMMAEQANEFKMQLASGSSGPAIGFTTQDITLNGQTDVNAFHDRIIGKMDLPVKLGRAVSLRKPRPGSEIEVEGHGVIGGGNLLCTSGAGALASNTPAYTRLSFLQGTIRIAQAGEWSQAILLQSGLTLQNPQDASGLRVRIRITDPVEVVANGNAALA